MFFTAIVLTTTTIDSRHHITMSPLTMTTMWDESDDNKVGICGMTMRRDETVGMMTTAWDDDEVGRDCWYVFPLYFYTFYY
jgi:hypothetical protein